MAGARSFLLCHTAEVHTDLDFYLCHTAEVIEYGMKELCVIAQSLQSTSSPFFTNSTLKLCIGIYGPQYNYMIDAINRSSKCADPDQETQI